MRQGERYQTDSDAGGAAWRAEAPMKERESFLVCGGGRQEPR